MLDSRTNILKETHPTLPLERTYCVSCGAPKGWVSAESYEFISTHQILVVCDKCEESYGHLDLPVVDIREI